MSDLTKTLIDIASFKPFNVCLCGEKINPYEIWCVRCKGEKYAERKQGERELLREVYPEVFHESE